MTLFDSYEFIPLFKAAIFARTCDSSVTIEIIK